LLLLFFGAIHLSVDDFSGFAGIRALPEGKFTCVA
jgi:hypothetical protein